MRGVRPSDFGDSRHDLSGHADAAHGLVPGKFVKEQFIAKDVIERQSLEVLTSFGDGGRQPGQFFGVHSIATDSKGNI